jgi:hypothetical protein
MVLGIELKDSITRQVLSPSPASFDSVTIFVIADLRLYVVSPTSRPPQGPFLCTSHTFTYFFKSCNCFLFKTGHTKLCNVITLEAVSPQACCCCFSITFLDEGCNYLLCHVGPWKFLGTADRSVHDNLWACQESSMPLLPSSGFKSSAVHSYLGSGKREVTTRQVKMLQSTVLTESQSFFLNKPLWIVAKLWLSSSVLKSWFGQFSDICNQN